MTAKELGLTPVADLLAPGELKHANDLLRDMQRVGVNCEALAMATETRDAADAEGGPTDQDMRIARKALDQLYTDQLAEQTGLPAFDRAASLAPGREGSGFAAPAPPDGYYHPPVADLHVNGVPTFVYGDFCEKKCPAYRLLEEHSRGDRDGLGTVRGLFNVLIGFLALAVFAGLTFWAGTRF